MYIPSVTEIKYMNGVPTRHSPIMKFIVRDSSTGKKRFINICKKPLFSTDKVFSKYLQYPEFFTVRVPRMSPEAKRENNRMKTL